MTSSGRLDLEAFERLLEIHGSRVERWPDAAREALGQLLEESPMARARWEEAKALDALLAAAPEVEPTAALVARIASLPALHPRAARPAWWPFQSSLAPLFAWGAAAALGVVVGIMQAPEPELNVGDVTAELGYDLAGEAAVDEGSSDDWTEVSGLVMGADWALEDE
jgi:hypothetical protein